jgi:REP element-mobilizing transposase RayT
MARQVQPKQRSFEFKGWGGRRKGAGRPRKPGAKLRHAERAPLASRYPAHVTLRAVPGAPTLRRSPVYAAIQAAIEAANAREGFRVVHFTVQTNHLHAVVEASGTKDLSRGMQGLSIRLARAVNRAAKRRGRLWADRYHARILRTPREVRNALCYVLQNSRRHSDRDRGIVEPGWIDPCSSGRWFDGWRGRRGPTSPPGTPPVASPRTWLLATGWRRAGLIAIDEAPGGLG